MLTNSMIRLKAKRSLKNNMHFALLIALTVALPNLLCQVVQLVTTGNLVQEFINQTLPAMENGTANPDIMLEKIMQIASNQSPLLYVFMAVDLVVVPALTLGEYSFMFKLQRGEAGEYKDVFSKMGSLVKALGLKILVTLKVFLWMLPGIAVFAGSAIMLLMNEGGYAWIMLMQVGMLLMLIMGIRANLSYGVAMQIMAEDTSIKITECINRSKKMMQGRRMKLLGMTVIFYVYNMAAEMISSTLSMLVGSVIGMTVSMVLSLMVNVYMVASVCAFYSAYKNGEPNAEDYLKFDIFTTPGSHNDNGDIESDDNTVE